MPKTVILQISKSEKDREYLRSLAGSSKLAAKCTYVGTLSGRFVICYEKRFGKFIYYAVDQVSGKFSHVLESSFEFSESALAREIGASLVKAIKHTGVFNRAKFGGKTQKSLWTTLSRVEV